MSAKLHLSTPWKFSWLSLALVFLAFYLLRAHQVPGTDVRAYYIAGQAFLEGSSIYAEKSFPFKYMPLFALIISPFTLLPFYYFKFFMALLGWASMVGVYRILIQWLGSWPSLLALVFAFRFYNHEIHYLQVNNLNLFLLMLSLIYKNKRGNLSAFLLAFVASTKLTPLMLLAVPFLRFDTRFWTRTLLIFLGLNLGVAMLTPEKWMILSSWQSHIAATSPYPASSNGDIQSINTALWSVMKVHFPHPQVFFAILSSLFVFMLGITLWPIYKVRFHQANTGEMEIATLCAILLLMLLFSPTAWKYIYIQAVPAAALLISRRYTSIVAASFVLGSLMPKIFELFMTKAQAKYTYVLVGSGIILWLGTLMVIYDEYRLHKKSLS